MFRQQLSERNGYGDNKSDLRLVEENSSNQGGKSQKWNIVNNALGGSSKSPLMSSRKRSRGSTTDDKKTGHKSEKYRLKYDQTKYRAEKDKVIQARTAKFGIFKKQKSKDKREMNSSRFEMRDDTIKISDSTS